MGQANRTEDNLKLLIGLKLLTENNNIQTKICLPTKRPLENNNSLLKIAEDEQNENKINNKKIKVADETNSLLNTLQNVSNRPNLEVKNDDNVSDFLKNALYS